MRQSRGLNGVVRNFGGIDASDEPTADDSLADMGSRIRSGMAIAAMIRMMATTISSSMGEKPFVYASRVAPSI
jgi:hypothetical protein